MTRVSVISKRLNITVGDAEQLVAIAQETVVHVCWRRREPLSKTTLRHKQKPERIRRKHIPICMTSAVIAVNSNSTQQCTELETEGVRTTHPPARGVIL